MLTSKQRAQLRALANSLEPVLIVGKGGVTENVVQEAENALRTRELLKGRVLETSLLTAREACDGICAATGAEGVQAIGTKFVLYRENPALPEEKRITLRKQGRP